MQASLRNCRNQASDAKGEAQGQKPRGESTDALVWGGPACSSDEGFVGRRWERGYHAIFNPAFARE